MLPNTNMVSHSFYTQSTFRFGDYYGHIGLFPVEDDMKSHTEKVKNSDSREALRDWLEQYFAENPAKYEIKVRATQDTNTEDRLLTAAADTTGDVARAPSNRRRISCVGRGNCALPDNSDT
jgi:hypothetical protein